MSETNFRELVIDSTSIFKEYENTPIETSEDMLSETISVKLSQIELPEDISVLENKIVEEESSKSIIQEVVISDIRGDYGIWQQQKRASEDRYQIKQLIWTKVADDPDINSGSFRYLVVFDGHGGTNKMSSNHVADYCVNHLHERLAKKLETVNLDDEDEMIDAIKLVFITLDTEMYELHQEHKKAKFLAVLSPAETNSAPTYPNAKYGCTCTMILIDDTRKKIYQVNLGDSRSIIFDRTEIISATIDHNPADELECIRIRNAGGYVYFGRVDGILAVTRAFGDFKFKNTKELSYDSINGRVCAVPEIKIIPYASNMHIILTSDAPYEYNAFNDNDLVTMFREHKTEDTSLMEVANMMVNRIIPRTTDDTTIVLTKI